MSSLTYRDFESIRCAHCGEPFHITSKGKGKDGPDDVPWVTGGIISFLGDEGETKHYHGYINQSTCCYNKANPSG